MKQNARGILALLLSLGLAVGCEHSVNALPPPEVADVFRELRANAFGLQPAELGLDADRPEVLAVVMETGYPDAVVSLVAVIDGSASLYFSHGGGVIGGGEHDDVARSARAFVESARSFLPLASPAVTQPLPAPGEVIFYLVTPDGIQTQTGGEEELGTNHHPFSRLFHHGHAVIASLREKSDPSRSPR